MADRSDDDALEHAVRYVPPGDLNVYGVTDADLHRLADGGPSSTFLTFALPLFGSAVSFIVVITTVDRSEMAFSAFFTATLVFAVSSLVLFALWWRTRTSLASVVAEIRDRRAPDPGDRLPAPGATK